MFVKVCGITSPEQIDWAMELGYTAIGVVLHHRSVRCCNAGRARELADYARGKITSVAVGVGYDEVADLYRDFDFVQAYEYRGLERFIYAGDTAPGTLDAAYFMYDSSRGSGTKGQFPAWLHELKDRLIISGGLMPDTVGEIIREFQPFGVDVSTGVERMRGIKDYRLMAQFITEVYNAI
jgi:phosphoribosylanthranilate isomerase